jgi:cyclophilin family peptidyl-prolyl cis-trans isomerase
MKSPSFETELEQELSALQSEYGIGVEKSIIRRTGFTGHEELLVVLKFILTGVTSAFLKKLGEEIWNRLKSTTQRILSRDEQDSVYQVIIMACVGNETNNTKFVCTATSKEDINKKLQMFQEALQAQLADNETLQKSGGAEYHLLENGAWKKR